jgi:hypothetical protein
MKFSDVDRRLNRYFEIILNLESPKSLMTRAVNFSGICSITRDNDNFFFNIFLPKDSDVEKFKPFFTLFGIEERELYYLSRERITDIRFVGLIKDLDSIKGLTINFIYIRSGYTVISGFMHENSEMEFSDMLSKHIHGESIISGITLKQSQGMLNSMQDECVKLKSILISLPLKNFEHYRVTKLLRDTGSIGQFVDNNPLNGSFRLIIYSNTDISSVDGIEEISGIDHIYETETDDEILLKLASKAHNKNVTWNFLFMYASDDKLFLNFILPEFRSKEYFNLIVDTEMDFKKLDWVTIESYREISYKMPLDEMDVQ